jgi:hypothetical protein
VLQGWRGDGGGGGGGSDCGSAGWQHRKDFNVSAQEHRVGSGRVMTVLHFFVPLFQVNDFKLQPIQDSKCVTVHIVRFEEK